MITGKTCWLIVNSINGLISEPLKKEEYVYRIMAIRSGIEISR
jgi:hypothetical protein